MHIKVVLYDITFSKNIYLNFLFAFKEYKTNIYTIVDLFCKNGFLRALLHRRCDEKSISSKTYKQYYVYQGSVKATTV